MGCGGEGKSPHVAHSQSLILEKTFFCYMFFQDDDWESHCVTPLSVISSAEFIFHINDATKSCLE